MKRYVILILAVVVGMTGCRKEPVIDELMGEYMVYTAHDAGADFGKRATFFLPDSILLIDRGTEQKYWTDENARKITQRIVQGLEQKGFVRINDKENADMGVQTTYIRSVVYFVGVDDPCWWWNYPFYWSPDFWGDWTDWYAPYDVYYACLAGSFLVELVDLRQDPRALDKLRTMWTSFMGGEVSASNRWNMDRMLRAVDQSFAQSPYLIANP